MWIVSEDKSKHGLLLHVEIIHCSNNNENGFHRPWKDTYLNIVYFGAYRQSERQKQVMKEILQSYNYEEFIEKSNNLDSVNQPPSTRKVFVL